MKGQAFIECALRDVTIPSTLKVLEEATFQGCKSLKNVVLQDGLERIENGCFPLTGIQELTIPQTVREVAKDAFGGCGLRRVNVADGCQADIRRVVPANVTVRTLATLVIPDGTEIVQQSDLTGKSVYKVIIPKSVVEIGENAFRGQNSLEVVVFEEGSRLKTISEGAFRGCSSLKKIDLPEGLEKIGIFAFC